MLLAALAGGIGLTHPSTRALWPSDTLALVGTVALLSVHAHVCLRVRRGVGERVRLEHDGRHWRITLNPDTPEERTHHGCTVRRNGYRGSRLLLMDFVDRDGRRVEVEIHRDAVPIEAFSALHLALRFGARDRPPPRGSPGGSPEGPTNPALHSPTRPQHVESP